MLIQEAELTAQVLSRYRPDSLSPFLNIGSSTLEFRTRIQPYIHQLIVAPLEAAGVNVVHTDLKSGPGIDVSADLLDDHGFAKLRAVAPRFVLCANVLEHVEDPAAFANRCLDLLPAGGRVLFTVPGSYPYHLDPIDTMFRPTPDEILALLDRPVDVEMARIIEAGSLRDRLRERPWAVVSQCVILPFRSTGWREWTRRMAAAWWLVRPFRQSLLLVRMRP